MKKDLIKIVSVGGLGDALLTTPSFKSIKERKSGTKVIVYAGKRHREVYKRNPYIDKLFSISFLRHPIDFIRVTILRKSEFIFTGYSALRSSLYYRKNATEIIGELLEVELNEKNVQIFLSKKEEAVAKKVLEKFKNPIILHITSVTSKNQMWPIKNWAELIRSFPEYTFIQLGSSDEERVEGAVDLRGKTSLREALALLKFSLSFVGVVSVFAHATNAFDIPGVVLFGPSTPEIWGHTNNINLFKNLRCSPCVETLGDAKCPYGKVCIDSIEVAEVKAALLAQLSRRQS